MSVDVTDGTRPLDLDALIASRIRDIHDYPTPGIVFKDITPLLADHTAFAAVIDSMALRHGLGRIDKVVAMEARGFIFAAPLAYHIGAGFVPLRKAGKLPWNTKSATYDLEYGTATLEIHEDGIEPGERVLVVDDVLATGGTARAAIDLVRAVGGVVVGATFLMELGFLNGRSALPGDVDVHALHLVS